MVELTHSDSHHSVKMLETSTGEALAARHILTTSSSSTTFLADSGASHHICHDRSSFCFRFMLCLEPSKSTKYKDRSMCYMLVVSCSKWIQNMARANSDWTTCCAAYRVHELQHHFSSKTSSGRSILRLSGNTGQGGAEEGASEWQNCTSWTLL